MNPNEMLVFDKQAIPLELRRLMPKSIRVGVTVSSVLRTNLEHDPYPSGALVRAEDKMPEGDSGKISVYV